MNQIKKFLAMFLCLTMCFSMFPTWAFAQEEEVIAEDEVAEEAAVWEEPVYEEPITEEPAYEELPYEEPAYEEPVYEEPISEEPVYEEAISEEPSYEEAINEEPVIEEPVYEEPVNDEPIYEEVITEEASYEEPAYEEPTYEETVTEEPASEEPVNEELTEEIQEPVRVVFATEPADAVVSVYARDEAGNVQAALPEEDGSYLLMPGIWRYSISCDGYYTVEDVELIVFAQDSYEPYTVSLTLTAIPVAETPEAEETSEEAAAEEEVEIALFSEEQTAAAEAMNDVSGNLSEIATPITLDTPVDAVITNGGDIAYFSFVPDETDYYEFKSLATVEGVDPYGYLYNEDGEELTNNDDSSDRNFAITYELIGGQTYYFGARHYSGDTTGSFPVQLSLSNVIQVERVSEYSQDVEIGAAVTLKVSVAGRDLSGISYQWLKGSDKIPVECTGDTLEIASVGESSYYYCAVYNNGDIIQEIDFYVSVPQNFYAYAEQESFNLSRGDSVTLRVFVTGEDADHVTYKWLNGYSGTGNELYIDSVQYGATIYCEVRDQYNNVVTIPFYIKVTSPENISFDTAQELELGTVVDAEILNPEETLYYHFTPVESARYVISGLGDRICVYDADQNRISTYYNPYDTADRMLHFNESLEAGQGYYFTLNQDADDVGPVQIGIKITNNSFERAKTITVAEPFEINNEGSGEALYYSFVPETTGTYMFSSQDGWWTEIVLYDGDHNQIVTSYNEDEGHNETTLGYVLTESQQYYYSVIPAELGINRYILSIENHLNAIPAGVNDGNTTSIYVPYNEATELSVVAEADDMSSIKYAWYKDGTLVEGQNTATLTTEPITQYTEYNCTVSDQYGNSTGVWFYVRVDNNLRATAEEENVYVLKGENATLRVIADATDKTEIRYQWSELAYDEYDDEFYVNIEGEVSEVLTVEGVQNNTIYRCTVSDQHGNSTNVWFNVYLKAGNTSVDLAKEAVIGERGSYYDSFAATGNGETAYYTFTPSITGDYSAFTLRGDWYIESEIVLYDAAMNQLATNYESDYEEYNETLNCQLTAGTQYFYSIRPQQEGTCTFMLRFNNHFSATYDGETNEIFVPLNETATLAVIAEAVDKSGVTYEWYDINDDIIEGQTGETLTTDPITQYTEYYCGVIDDKYDNYAYVRFYVHVDNGLSATAEEENIFVVKGESATLRVIADATDSSQLNYQWKEYGIRYDDEEGVEDEGYWPIDGATSDALTIENVVEPKDICCTVSDQYGNTTTVDFRVYLKAENSSIETAKAIIVAEPFEINNEGSGEALYYSFVPETTGTYTFSSQDGWWTEIVLYDGEHNTIARNYNEDDGHNEAFLSYALTESQQYYYSVIPAELGINRYILSFENHLNATPAGVSDGNTTDIYVPYNEAAELSIVAEADDMSSIKYAWYKNWEVIEGQTASTLTTELVTQPITYYCEVSDQYGNSTTAWFYVYVDNNLSATAEQDTVFVVTGESAALKVISDATDSSQLKYQWKEYGIRYDDEEGVEDEGYWPIDGATSDALTIENVVEPKDICCEVSDQYGNTTTVNFRVYLKAENSSFETAKAITVAESFEINYEGSGETLYYSFVPETTGTYAFSSQDGWWTEIVLYDGEQNPIARNYNEDEGHNEAFLSYALTESQQYYYSVIPAELGINNYILSFENHLNATPAGVSDGNTTDIYVPYNEAAELSVVAEADDMTAITYAWYKNYELIEGQTASTLTTELVTQFTEYYCTVSDQYGNNRNVWFNVYVDNNLSATAEQDTVFVVSGENAPLKVIADATDSSQLKYQWKEYGYNEEEGWEDYWPIDGATSDALTIENVVEPKDIRCEVSDQYGNTTTVNFRVYLKAENTGFESAIELEVNKWFSVDGSEEAKYYKFTPTVTGTYILGNWSPNGAEIILYNAEGAKIGTSFYNYHDGGEVTLVYRPSLSYELEAGVTYYYSVRHFETGSSSFNLRYYNLNSASPAGDTGTVYASLGGTTTLTVKVDARDTSVLTYTWYLVGDEEDTVIEGETGQTLTTEPVMYYTEYYCRVSDPYENYETIRFCVCVDNNLSATAEEENVYVLKGENATLRVIADATDKTEIRYQWSELAYDEYGDTFYQNIEEEVSDVLTVEGVQNNNRYRCTVSDQYGNNQNVWFYVHVDNGFSVQARGDTRLTVLPGETVTLAVDVTAYDKTDLTYRWFGYKNGDYLEFPDATGDGLTLTADGRYRIRCYVTDKYENSESAEFTISIDNNLKVQSQINGTATDTWYVKPNETVQLSAVVTATEMEYFRSNWYLSTYKDDGSRTSDQLGQDVLEITSMPFAEDDVEQEYIVSINDLYSNYVTANFYLKPFTTNCGEDGADVQWSFDETSGTLTISGSGALAGGEGAWINNAGQITSIVVNDGVTAIGSGTFTGLPNVTSVTLPDSVQKISYESFTNCDKLAEVTLPSQLDTIEVYAFGNDTALTEITIPLSTKTIEYGAFANCAGLTTVYYPGTQAQWSTISIADRNDPLVNARLVLNHPQHAKVTQNAKAATCTEDGYTGDEVCSICGKVLSQGSKISAHGHNWDAGTVTKQATCTAEGVKTYHCTYDAGHTRTEAIAKTAHTPVADPAVPATCTETGKTEGSHCSVCGTVIKAQETIPAKGHTPVTDAAVPATCTETGLTEGNHCSVCGIVIKAQETIPAKGHTPVTDASVPATYTETGLTEGSHCSVCGTVIKAQETIAKLTLGSPASVTVKVAKTGVKVSWKAVEGAERYYVQRKAGSGKWTKVGYKTGTSFTDTTAKSGVAYRYRVRARVDTDKVNGAYTASSSLTYVAAPTISSVKNVAKGVTIKWKAVAGAEKYRIWRKAGSGKWTKLADTTKTSYTDKTVKSGTKYSYRIKCINSDGKLVNAYSATKTITFLAQAKISKTAVADGKITLTWAKVKGAKTYDVYRKAGNGKYVPLKEGVKKLTFADTDVKAGTKYSYKVVAVNGSITGAQSAATKAVNAK